MARKKKPEEHVNHERWMVSYADFMTLLFATFTALFAMSNADMAKMAAMAKSVNDAFGGGGGGGGVAQISLDTSLGKNPAGSWTIEVFPDAQQSSGDQASRSNQGSGGGEGDGEGDGDGGLETLSINKMEDPMANFAPAGTPGAQPESTPTPTPAPTPAPKEDLQSLGHPEGSGSKALMNQIKTILDTAGLQGKVEVRQEKRGMVISLGEAAFFAAGEIEVLPQCDHQLSKIVNALRNKKFEVRIEGHTDDLPIKSGRYRSNFELSCLRAASIADYMIREYGFSPQRISSAGYGEWRPIADNATNEGRQKNRRVDIVILNQESMDAEPH